MWDYHIWDRNARTDDEEGQRRAAHPGAARAAAAARLRAEQADRVPFEGRAHLPRRVVVSPAAASRGARAYRGALGGEGRPTAPPVLPHQRRGKGCPLEPAPIVEGVLRSH